MRCLQNLHCCTHGIPLVWEFTHFPVGVLPSVHYARLVLAWDPVFSSSYSGWDSSQQDSRLYFNPFVGAGGKDWLMCPPGTVLFPLTNPLYLHCLQDLRSCTLSNWFCHWTLPPPHVADNDNAETCASCERHGWQKDSLLFPLVCMKVFALSTQFATPPTGSVTEPCLLLQMMIRQKTCATCGRDSRQRYSREDEYCLLDSFPH